MSSPKHPARPIVWMVTSSILLALATVLEARFDYGSTQWWHIPLYILVAVMSERAWEYREMVYDHEERMRTWRKHEVRGKVDQAFDRYMANRSRGDRLGRGSRLPQKTPPKPQEKGTERRIF